MTLLFWQLVIFPSQTFLDPWSITWRFQCMRSDGTTNAIHIVTFDKVLNLNWTNDKPFLDSNRPEEMSLKWSDWSMLMGFSLQWITLGSQRAKYCRFLEYNRNWSDRDTNTLHCVAYLTLQWNLSSGTDLGLILSMLLPRLLLVNFHSKVQSLSWEQTTVLTADTTREMFLSLVSNKKKIEAQNQEFPQTMSWQHGKSTEL